MMHTFATLTLIAMLGVAVVFDLRTRRIPNVLTVTGLLVALALRAGAGTGSLMAGLAGAGIALALTFPLVMLGGLGGGDAKLLAAVGGFLGPGSLPTALLVTALTGGAMALVLALRRGVLGETLAHGRDLITGLAPGSAGRAGRARTRTIHTPGAMAIPYGVAITIGGLAGWFT
ncbi:MAG TPA: prepilin peptidase [Gemmatimonadota bacterium]|nr:prepilin peptidase [Gemmatimonadota bacterium]